MPGKLADHDVIDLVRVDEQLIDRQLLDRFRQTQHDAVVAPHQLDVHAPALSQAGLQRHGPRCVHLRAERRQDADPPIADLVAESLDDDRAVVRHRAGDLGLLVEVQQQVGRGTRVEVMQRGELLERLLDR